MRRLVLFRPETVILTLTVLLLTVSGCGNDQQRTPTAPVSEFEVPGIAPTASASTDRLKSGERLNAGQRLNSPNGRSSLIMQTDGNLVVYHFYGSQWLAKWATGTDGVSGARVVMQTDGNLVVYDSQWRPRWASNTNGAYGSFLVMQNDGNLVIYDPQGRPRWASNTVCEMSSGWYWPTGTDDLGSYLGWLDINTGWGYHLAKDIKNAAGRPVYSIGTGEIISSGEHTAYGCNGTCTGGCVLARYRSANGTWFTVLYGHLDNYRGTGPVKAGEIVGYTIPDWNKPHLHFAVHPGYDPASNPWRGYTSNKSTLYGFVEPLGYLRVLKR
jgi:murein DD-endopeptidase MepM/ murein hydrolase activator NlpD